MVETLLAQDETKTYIDREVFEGGRLLWFISSYMVANSAFSAQERAAGMRQVKTPKKKIAIIFLFFFKKFSFGHLLKLPSILNLNFLFSVHHSLDHLSRFLCYFLFIERKRILLASLYNSALSFF